MKILISIIVNVLVICVVNAQCSMCKAAAEQSDYASGLNEGILYLMPLPAIIMTVFGIILYVNYKKKNVQS